MCLFHMRLLWLQSIHAVAPLVAQAPALGHGLALLDLHGGARVDDGDHDALRRIPALDDLLVVGLAGVAWEAAALRVLDGGVDVLQDEKFVQRYGEVVVAQDHAIATAHFVAAAAASCAGRVM